MEEMAGVGYVGGNSPSTVGGVGKRKFWSEASGNGKEPEKGFRASYEEICYG